MSDLIDRQAAIMALVFSDDTGGMTCGQMAKVLDVIKAAPSAQPERIRGRWGTTVASPTLIVCNRCGRTVLKNGSVHWNFCPACGADMREVDGERHDLQTGGD